MDFRTIYPSRAWSNANSASASLFSEAWSNQQNVEDLHLKRATASHIDGSSTLEGTTPKYKLKARTRRICKSNQEDNCMNTHVVYSPSEANERLKKGDALLVDVRDAEDFRKGHIPGSVNIPEMFTTLSMTTPEGLREMQDIFTPLLRNAGINRDQTVIVYEDCLHTRYGGSCRGYFQLRLFGHRDVGILDGGLSQWLEDGFPVTSDISPVVPSDFVPSLNPEFLATLEDMVAAIDDPNVKLLDNRDEDEWRGLSSSPYGVDFTPRKGRIPGARWVEWYEFIDTKQKIPHFKSGDEIRAICAQVGLDVNDNIIIYCFKGARASNTLIALQIAGFTKVRNYYGSWNEWSRRLDLPIDDELLAA
jgi:thiosulfate/3-mercaptopyruvate sulfurtransferase